MRKIILLIGILLSFSAQAVDKAFFNQVIISNVNDAIQTSEKMIKNINQGNQGNIKNAQATFAQLVNTWKKVESTYVLGDLNEDYLDTPRYIDIFHGNNEDIKQQLDLIINTTDDLSYALYKNSHKTINALEYVLFTQDISNKRVGNMALIMAKSINQYLRKILLGYQQNKSKFLKSEQFASAVLLNTLVADTYKLKEWRIGDVLGLSKKYLGKADAHRAEYTISNNSMNAIRSILVAHKQVIDANGYKDFGDVAREFGANKQINIAIQRLNHSIQLANNMTDANFVGSKGEALYVAVSQLMQSYYISLMDRLGFVSKVLDADGD
ncbi:FIG00387820: hypothetical protein [uncultured Candidatus Thioglobus sp.]|nr:FIG00387820: hypothetical protein [uncultured Candidatus Thioglobus sp.]